MDYCHISRPFARRSFIVTAYTVGDGGRFAPLMPLACVAEAASSGGDDPCRIWLHHRRPRKTGPGFPLTVVECRTHGVVFTLYPPGYVPYGRVAMAPVDPGGRLLRAPTERDEQDELCAAADEQGDSDAGQLTWDATLFDAAQDAARGLPWPRRNSSGPGGWRTQGRWIVLGATILGLTSPLREVSADQGLLGVSALTQRESTLAYADAHGYRDRGRAVTLPLLDLEHAGPFVLEWLLVAGFVAARWGRPRRSDPRSGRLRDIAPRARAP
jgi:hypothetical protein